MKSPVLLGLACICLSAASAADIPSSGIVEEIVAKVNGDIITRTDLANTRKQIEMDLRQQGIKGVALTDEVRKREADILRERIDELLLVQKAKDLNISVDNDVSKYVADMQRQSGIADPEKFQQFVKEQTGMPFEDYKAEIKNNALRQRVVGREVYSRIQVSSAELRKYYDEHMKDFVRDEKVFLREIFISTDGKDAAGKAAAEKKAKDLVARARKGEKFFELARDNSDSMTAKQGGELGGWKRSDGLEQQLVDIVFTHDRGYVSDPIQKPNGYLILRIEDRFKPGQAAFEEVEGEVRDKLLGPRAMPAIREFLTKLRKEAFLEIKEGYVDSGAAQGQDTAWKDPAVLKPETISRKEVVAKTHLKRLLWVMPMPGTRTTGEGTSQSR